MKVNDYLKQELLQDRFNYKTGFTVYWKKKYYLCTIQELNALWGKCEVIWCKLKNYNGKPAQNSYQIKVEGSI